MSLDVEQLRQAEFPWAVAGESIYLNTASIGPMPQRSVDAVAKFNAMRGAPHRISHEFQFGTLARSRELLARLIGADASEIGLATNTSFGINVAAFSLPLGRGDIVLGFEHEFPANVYPWMAAAKQRGFEFRLLPSPRGVPSQQTLLDAMRAPGVKAVAISWAEFASGYRFDLAEIGAECKRRGIFFFVDAIQGLGPATLDVRTCHVDVLACGAQKWLLSPWGTGFTYVRKDLIPAMEPGFVSWLNVRGSDDFAKLVDYDMTWRDDARRFEFITLPFQEFAGLNASLEMFFDIGLETIQSATNALTDLILDWAKRNGVEPATPVDPGHRAGIVALRLADSAARSRELTAAGVTHSLREGAIRLSPYFFNTTREIQTALGVLEEAKVARIGTVTAR